MALRRTLNAAMQIAFFADREQRKRGMFRLDLESLSDIECYQAFTYILAYLNLMHFPLKIQLFF